MFDVWWVNQYAVTPDLPGGTRHYDLGVELARRGFGVTIFASDVNHALRQHTKLQPGQFYTVEQLAGIKFVWLQSSEYRGNNWLRVWNMMTFSRNLIQAANRFAASAPPSVVIGSSPSPLAALAAERVAVRTGARFLLELRDLWPQALVDMGGLTEWHPGVVVLRSLERYLYRRADFFIVLAEGSRRYLEQRGIPASRVLFLPNGVHLGHFQSRLSRQEARAQYGFERFTVVYVGAHGPANSLETVIKAAKLLCDLPVEFVLVGDGPTKPGLISLAKQEGVTNIRFLDPVPKIEVPSLLKAADVGLITLKSAKAFEYGISPNKLFDYMAASLPIICSVPGDMAAMIREAQAGLITRPEDPTALAAAVREMVDLDSDVRQQFGQNAQTYLIRHFRREVLADQLAGILHASSGDS